MTIKLKNLSEDCIKIVLQEDKLINHFNCNKPIPVNNLRNYVINNEDNYIIKQEKKFYKKDTLSRIAIQESVTPSGLYNVLRSILLGKTKNKNNDKYELVNPVLILMFYERLENDGFEFIETINNFIELRHYSKETNVSIKTREAFKIFINLINNKNLLELLPNVRETIFKNFTVGKSLLNLPYIICDIICKIAPNNTIIISLDQTFLSETDMFEKDASVLSHYDSLIIHYNVNSPTQEFIDILNERVARKSYHYNNIGAISFYLSLKGIDPGYCLFFTKIFENKNKKGILFRDIIDFLKMNNFKNALQCYKEAVNNGELSKEDFNHEWTAVVHAINRKSKKLPKIYINFNGFHSIMNYPRNSDWKFASQVKKYFAIFTEEYFKFIRNFLSNFNIEKKYWKKSNQDLREFNTVHKILKVSMLKHLEDKIKLKETTIDIHPTIPILVKDENSKIQVNSLIEKIYGLNLKVGQNLNEHPDYNNSIYNDIKYRIDQLESKEYIDKYRIINQQELKSLI
tara:strand:+ start:2076 stop:3620 length:1545 start_codon:yes stop_codon:yes gene_type:complete